ISVAVTEDPISMPGYSVYGNDEGSIIPKNAVEVHFGPAPASTGNEMTVRAVHVFRDFKDTVYSPEPYPRIPYEAGKLNHYEISVSETGVAVSLSPYSEDGVTFAPATSTYKVDVPIPFSRGYVHASVHNHATMKYTQPQDHWDAVVDASVAHLDNVG